MYLEKEEVCPRCGSRGADFNYDTQRCRCGWPAAASPHQAAEGIAAEIRDERWRQIEKEGWSPQHDDALDGGELAKAASCYLWQDENTQYKLAPIMVRNGVRSADDPDVVVVGYASVPVIWPWRGQHWKPKDRRTDLIRAAALIVAEIERLDRLTKTQHSKLKTQNSSSPEAK
jgi:hypothetical protein